jgi:putative glycerol-1-phosphate prenyltransferase
MKNIYAAILDKKRKGGKFFSVLVDPDKFNPGVIDQAEKWGVDFFLVGGSIITNGSFEACVNEIKKRSAIPLIIFPGNHSQVSGRADAILLLSLISGRNPEYLIGQHVKGAMKLKESGLEVIPTGYMLVDGQQVSSTQYITATPPIPREDAGIAVSTALAGEMLGLKMIYLEAGSGAKNPVSARMIERVKEKISIPLIAGGGIRTARKAAELCRAGADMVVVGNAIEKDALLIRKLACAIHSV